MRWASRSSSTRSIRHSSDQHAWFQESRSSRDNAQRRLVRLGRRQADGSPPNNWQSVFGGPAWQWDARRGQYYLHNFLAEQPDLNLHNPEVQDAMLSVAHFWLDRGVDGFRIDAINFAMHDPHCAIIRLRPKAASGLGRSISSSTSTTSPTRESSTSSSGCAATDRRRVHRRRGWRSRPASRDARLHRWRSAPQQRLWVRLPLCRDADPGAGCARRPGLAR